MADINDYQDNPALQKSFAFGVRVLKLYQWFYKNHKDVKPLVIQLLRSGTSVGANVEEADSAYSKREFAMKIGISLKEARESRYWIKLLKAGGYLDDKMYQSMYDDCQELIKILTAILKTARNQ